MTREPNLMLPALASMMVSGCDGVFFERRARRYDLERRSGLVIILHCSIAPRFRARVTVVVRA